jgi:hypothetical protein
VDQQHIYISDTKTKLQFYLGWFGFTFPAALYGYVFFSTINRAKSERKFLTCATYLQLLSVKVKKLELKN